MRHVWRQVGEQVARGVAGLFAGVRSQKADLRPAPSAEEVIRRFQADQPVTDDQLAVIEVAGRLQERVEDVLARVTSVTRTTVRRAAKTTRTAARRTRRLADTAVQVVAVPVETLDRRLYPVRQYVAAGMLAMVLIGYVVFILLWAGMIRLTAADAVRCVVGTASVLAAMWWIDRVSLAWKYYKERAWLRTANMAVTACVVALGVSWLTTTGVALVVDNPAVVIAVALPAGLGAAGMSQSVRDNVQAAHRWLKEKPERAVAARQAATAIVVIASAAVMLMGLVSVLRSVGIGWMAVLFALPLAWKMLARHV